MKMGMGMWLPVWCSYSEVVPRRLKRPGVVWRLASPGIGGGVEWILRLLKGAQVAEVEPGVACR